ncbi:tyrosine-type recombinase/integrase [Pontibacillus salicampi]|uniref:Tyrosine-type recombinase/integrase n=1 Tax=Pontibacillus salicampi TaxID=1449801 RepID=A0ABV6LU59_9BACI
MNIVQPIRDTQKLVKMKNYLRATSERNYMMFLLGISTGLRISDILMLRKEDLLKSHIYLKEKKTTKAKRVKIPGYIKKEIVPYAKHLQDGEYVIRSRQGGNQPIDRSTAYRILRKAADYVNLEEIGTHTLRKTFGYHYYKKTKNIGLLQNLFNHTNQQDTLRYIGINQDLLDDAMDTRIY